MAGIANSGITTTGWEANWEGWVDILEEEELVDDKGRTEVVTGTTVIWWHFGTVTGVSLDTVVLVVFSIAGEESVEMPSTGTVTGRDAGG